MYKVYWSTAEDNKPLEEHTLEFKTKEEAIIRFHQCWMSECIARIWEDEEGIKVWSRDEFADYLAVLPRWEGMENDVWVEYGFRYDKKDYKFRTLKETYLKQCELYGVEPSENYEEMLRKEEFVHDSFGNIWNRFFLRCSFMEIDACFHTVVNVNPNLKQK